MPLGLGVTGKDAGATSLGLKTSFVQLFTASTGETVHFYIIFTANISIIRSCGVKCELAAQQMFANALIFVKDSVFQMLLNFLEKRNHLSRFCSFCLFSLFFFHFSSSVPLCCAQWPSSAQDTRHFSTVAFLFLINLLGFSLY